MADDDSFRLPLYSLIVNSEGGKASSGRQFKREPGGYPPGRHHRRAGTLEDARAAIDAAASRSTAMSATGSQHKLREQALFRTARVRDDADRLARVKPQWGCRCARRLPHRGRRRHFRVYAGLAGKLYGEAYLPSGSMINLVKEPVGVVEMITWNFPLTQTARKVAPPRRRLHHRDQTGELHPGRHLRTGQAHPAGRSTEGCAQHGPGSREVVGRRSSPTRRWTRSPSPARRHRQDDRAQASMEVKRGA